VNKLRDYEFKEIEKKWQERWSKDNIFKTENEVEGKENYYVSVNPEIGAAPALS